MGLGRETLSSVALLALKASSRGSQFATHVGKYKSVGVNIVKTFANMSENCCLKSWKLTVFFFNDTPITGL